MAPDVNSSDLVNQSAQQPPEAQQDDRTVNFERLRKKTESLEAQLQEKEQLFQRQQAMLDQMQQRLQPSVNELDSLADDDIIDKAKLNRIRESDRQQFLKEAEQVARQTYEKLDSENFATKLKYAYPDYDQVVNSANAEKLQEQDPEFMSLLAEVKDEFKRRELAYKRMKKLEDKPKVKAQDVVEENRKAAGAFYAPSGSGPTSNPYAFEFDVRNKDARANAYAKLKAAQKRSF
jgi:hypothetical protein